MADQPAPKKNDRQSVVDILIERIRERDELGMRRYGVRLQPFNGRESLVDVRDELLDGVIYIQQAMEEMGELVERVKGLEAENTSLVKMYELTDKATTP